MSLRKDILDQMIAWLNDPSKAASIPDAKKLRGYSIDEKQLPAIRVSPMLDDAQQQGGVAGPITYRTMTMAVDCFASADSSEDPLDKIDLLLAWTVSALCGRRGTANAGPFKILREQKTEWFYAQKDLTYVRARARFEIEYQSKTNDLSSYGSP